MSEHSKPRRGRSIVVWTLALGAVALLAGGAGYLLGDRLVPVAALAAQVPEPAAGPLEPSGDTPFHEHVAQAGMAACLDGFPLMGALVTGDASYAVQSKWTPDRPAGGMIRSLIGMRFETPEHSGPAVGYVMAAPSGGACEGGMIRVTPIERSCAEVERQFLAGATLEAELEGLPAYLAEGGDQVVTLPLGEHCVAVSVGRLELEAS